MSKASGIEKIVRSALRERFPKIHVVGVNIDDDTDEDGDAILRIRIIFESGDKDFDPTKIPPLMRAIIPKLSAAHLPGFPILSFIAKSDLGKLKPETA